MNGKWFKNINFPKQYEYRTDNGAKIGSWEGCLVGFGAAIPEEHAIIWTKNNGTQASIPTPHGLSVEELKALALLLI